MAAGIDVLWKRRKIERLFRVSRLGRPLLLRVSVPAVPAVPAVAAVAAVPAIPPLFLSDSYSFDPQGVIGGAHAGYDYQFSQWVIGLEGTIDGSSLNKSVVGFPGFTDSINIPIQGAILGRVGVAFDRVLIYATGGAAIADVSNTYNANVIAPVSLFVSGKVSHTRVGWTVGAGFDYAINDNWSVGVQYRYSDFGRFTDYPSAAFSPVGGWFAAQHHLTENQVQFELSYKFDTTSPIPFVAKY
jgi:outer membrane immunogenic protein